MNFAISNVNSPNFMAKKPLSAIKRIGDGFKHFKETDPEGYKQFMTAINEKNSFKLQKSQYTAAVDFYKNQGFEKAQLSNLVYIPKQK